jgi:hypothetical protein
MMTTVATLDSYANAQAWALCHDHFRCKIVEIESNTLMHTYTTNKCSEQCSCYYYPQQ